MSFIKPKPVLQRTSHRGHLEISPHLKIPVRRNQTNASTNKLSPDGLLNADMGVHQNYGEKDTHPQEGFNPLSSLYVPPLLETCHIRVVILPVWAIAADEGASHEVKLERSYQSMSDPDVEVRQEAAQPLPRSSLLNARFHLTKG